MRADLLRGHVDSLLPAALAGAPGHGYEITDAGRRAVERSCDEWKAFSTAVDQVMGTA